MKFLLQGTLADCFLLSCSTPIEKVRHLVRSPLELITADGLAFWNIVLCRVENMRPAGLPSCTGISYCHIAYRLYVKAPLPGGAEQRGLYFLRSDVDSRLIGWGSNLFTDFKCRHARIDWDVREEQGRVMVESAGGGAHFRFTTPSLARPVGPLESLLRYEPAGLSLDKTGTRLRVTEIFRDESQWREDPIEVTEARWEFLEQQGERGLKIVRATRVEPIRYRWAIGKELEIARLKQPASLVAS